MPAPHAEIPGVPFVRIRTAKTRLSSVAAILALLLSAASCAGPSKPRIEVGEPIFYPAAPGKPRIQFLFSIHDGTQIEEEESGLDKVLFGDLEKTKKPIQRPFSCVVHDGFVYVSDSVQGAVLRFDFKNGKAGYAPLKGRAQPQNPGSLVFADDGTLYLTDVGRKQVIVVDENWKYKKEFGPFGADCRPVGIAIHGDRLYITDFRGARVLVIDRHTGKELFSFANDPKDPVSYVRGPTGIAIDKDGYVYVVDTIYSRVQVYDKDGKFVRRIGSRGRISGMFSRPKGIAVCGDFVWVIDAAFENAQVFTKNGQVLTWFGGSNGRAHMYLPAQIHVTEEGLDLFKDYYAEDFVPQYLILVTNQYGPNKLSFYAYGKSKNFEYPKESWPKVPAHKIPAAEKPDPDAIGGGGVDVKSSGKQGPDRKEDGR